MLINDEIGDINKPNKIGLLPHEIEHIQPLQNVPDHVRDKFPLSKIEDGEADYLIVCKENKKTILID